MRYYTCILFCIHYFICMYIYYMYVLNHIYIYIYTYTYVKIYMHDISFIHYIYLSAYKHDMCFLPYLYLVVTKTTALWRPLPPLARSLPVGSRCTWRWWPRLILMFVKTLKLPSLNVSRPQVFRSRLQLVGQKDFKGNPWNKNPLKIQV